MIIEFTGLPGSGKSTLHQALQKHLESKGYNVWTPRNYWEEKGLLQQAPCYKRTLAASHKAALLGFHAILGFRLVKAVPWLKVLNGRTPQHRMMVLKSFFSELAERYIANRFACSSTIALIDEGLVHRAYGLFVSHKNIVNFNDLEHYGRAVILPTHLIYIKVKSSTSFRRIIRRGLPFRMVGLPISKMLQMLSEGEKLLDHLMKFIQNKQAVSCHVIEIDGEQIDDAKMNLFGLIENYIHPLHKS